MRRIIHNFAQRTPEWYAIRRGKVTASNAHKLLTPAKFKTYFTELAAETVVQLLTESYVSPAMEWGIEQEPFAMEWYGDNKTQDIYTVGFIEIEGMAAGCSPDLLVGEDGMVQIKCPAPKNHVDCMINGVDKEYIVQMQYELFVSERKWNDFLSFDPRWPDHLKGHVIRFERDEEMIKVLEEKTREMEALIDMFMLDKNIVIQKFVEQEAPIPFDKSLYLTV
jgi:predicted phage-related endonuclease